MKFSVKPSAANAVFTVGVLSLLASLLVVNVSNAEWSFWPWSRTAAVTSSSSSSSAAPIAVAGTVGSAEQQVINVVKNSQPSVVSVIISKNMPVLEQVPSRQSIPGPFGNDPFFQQFQFNVPQYVQRGTRKTEIGGGTAFFVSADGLLMTNKHVVSDPAAMYTVLLNDGRKLDATVAATDPTNDIALLRVQGSGFTPLTIASSDTLQLGQTAIAIGNALGEFRNTVSVGVVSGLQRSITAGDVTGTSEQLDQIIQTDAAINEGNSGGPLLDSSGNVIGMNTAIASGAQNIGFALPAGELRRVLQSFQKNGRIVRPYLGVRYIPITTEVKNAYKLSYDYGVYVSRGQGKGEPAVMPGSPAAKAGVKDGDVILEIDGRKLTQDISLLSLIQAKAPGDIITLKIARGKTEKTVQVTLQEWSVSAASASSQS